jgi:hypothetical protein
VVQTLSDQLVGPVALDLGPLGGDRGDDPEAVVVTVDPRTAGPVAVGQARQALDGKPPALGRDALVVDADRAGDLPVGDAVGGQQDDARPAQGTLGRGVCPQTTFSSVRCSTVISSGGTLDTRGLLTVR